MIMQSLLFRILLLITTFLWVFINSIALLLSNIVVLTFHDIIELIINWGYLLITISVLIFSKNERVSYKISFITLTCCMNLIVYDIVTKYQLFTEDVFSIRNGFYFLTWLKFLFAVIILKVDLKKLQKN